jgi:hypothetical protein
MKKILLISLICLLTACENKSVSKDYYSSHLSEAREELIKCANNKEENGLSCDNARSAIQAALSKIDDDKVANSLR